MEPPTTTQILNLANLDLDSSDADMCSDGTTSVVADDLRNGSNNMTYYSFVSPEDQAKIIVKTSSSPEISTIQNTEPSGNIF